MTGAELARIAGLPRQRIYDVLDGLVGRGLATGEPGRPAYYTAVAPDHAIGLLLEAHRAALGDLEEDAARAVALLTPAYRAGRTETDPLNFLEVRRRPARRVSFSRSRISVAPRLTSIVPRRRSWESTAFTVARDAPASAASWSCVTRIGCSSPPYTCPRSSSRLITRRSALS